MIEEIIKLINAYWKFDEYQQHLSTWHDKQDLIDAVMKVKNCNTPAVMHWVATSEQLPEFGKTVLVYCKIYGKFLATYEYIGEFAGEKYGNWRDFNGNLGILPPVYWMEISEPPCA
jgi:hypothetical protein